MAETRQDLDTGGVQELLPAPVPDKEWLNPDEYPAATSSITCEDEHEPCQSPCAAEQVEEKAEEEKEDKEEEKEEEEEEQEQEQKEQKQQRRQHDLEETKEMEEEEHKADQLEETEDDRAEGKEKEKVGSKTPPAVEKVLAFLLLRALWHLRLRQQPPKGPWQHILLSAAIALKRGMRATRRERCLCGALPRMVDAMRVTTSRCCPSLDEGLWMK